MKTLYSLLALAAALTLPVSAQTKHAMLGVAFGQTAGAPSATLSWTASATPGSTVTVFRCAGASCTTFTQLATGIAAGGPYVDTTVTAGAYSYYVTATVNGAVSAPSNTATGTLSPLPPTVLSVATAN